ncbi:unnamed protein product [Bemisia tabaci]|uniref:DNA 3'-5' helicase n=1 Tax=Bemisia tabaci TaxID=7038 RepID=A0A9P0F8H9_BEMTA|nr:unnamed protein product [Bemisia tabaci]
MNDPVYGKFALSNQRQVLKRLVGFLTSLRKVGHTVIFLPTIEEVKEYSRQLESKGIANVPFTGPMGEEVKTKHFSDWLSGQAEVMVATSVASLGIDNGECRSVIVVGLPNFIQKIGRAGRKTRSTTTILLHEGVRNISSVFEKLDAMT